MKYKENTKKRTLRRLPNPSEVVQMDLIKHSQTGSGSGVGREENLEERGHVSRSGIKIRSSKNMNRDAKSVSEERKSRNIEKEKNKSKRVIEVHLFKEHNLKIIDDEDLPLTSQEAETLVNKKDRSPSNSSRKNSPHFILTDVEQNGAGDLLVFENDYDDDNYANKTKSSKKPETRSEKKEKVVEQNDSGKETNNSVKTKKKKREKSAGRASSARRKPPIDPAKMIEYDNEKKEEEETVDVQNPVYVPSAIWQRPDNRRRKKKLMTKQTMVRVGGGWMRLCDYLHYHLPVKVYLQNSKQRTKTGNENIHFRSVRPTSASTYKQYDRPSWASVSKGFNGFGITVGRDCI